MKATIIEEKWDQAGNFIGLVLVENDDETWTSGGCQVFFTAPPTGHTRETIRAFLAQYAADHEVVCAAASAKAARPVLDSLAVKDDGTEVAISEAAFVQRAVKAGFGDVVSVSAAFAAAKAEEVARAEAAAVVAPEPEAVVVEEASPKG